MPPTSIITNLRNQQIRRDKLHGREYIVAPVNILTAGVHNGSNGPLYYPTDELAKTTQAWNTRPVVVYHPTQGTATTHAELTARQVGMLLNTRWDSGGNKLRSEAWLDPERLQAIAPEVLNALNNNQPMEVSTGLFTDNTPTPGVHNGQNYSHVARNYRPDHLAILPTGVGACSVAAGCGMLTHNEVSEMEQPLIAPTMNFGSDPGIVVRHVAHPAPVINAAQINPNEAPLLIPTMNFGCGCDNGAGGNGGQNTGQPANNAAAGQQAGESPLLAPSWPY